MIRFCHLTVGLLVGLFSVSVVLAGQTQEGIALVLSKARSLEARGRSDLAVQSWNQVLLIEPDQPEALAGLARSAKQTGDFARMGALLDRLRKINPQDPNIAWIEKLHVLTPQDIRTLDEAGELAAAHKFDEAMMVYRKLFGDTPPPGKWAEAFYETEAASTGGHEKALADLRALVARDPANDVYRLWFARVLTYAPQTRPEGLRLLESITDPSTVEQVRAVWHRALLWEKDNPASESALRAYLQRYPDPELQATLDLRHEREERAARDATEQLGYRALHDKDFGTAQTTFEGILRRRPTDADALAGLGFVRLDQERFDEALSLFEKARALTPSHRADVDAGYQTARFWLAMRRGRLLERNDPVGAMAAYELALTIRPQDNQPVLGMMQLINADSETPDVARTLSMVRSMSHRAFDMAATKTDFLNGVAHLYAIDGQCGEAETLLLRSIAVDKGAARQPAEQTMMQLAGIWMREGRYAQAGQAFHDVIASNASQADAWRGYLTALHQAHDDRTAVSEASRVPAPVSATLTSDASFLRLLASADAAVGDNDRAVEQLQRVRALYVSLQETPPPDLNVQLAWAMLDSAKYQPNLGELVAETRTRPDVSAAQRRAVEDAWSISRVRAAQNAALAENYAGAIEMLTRAARDLPASSNIRSALASVYMTQRDYDHALGIYQSWGMVDAAAGDYRAAAGAAFATHENILGERFLWEGRQRWPDDPELLHMTAMNALGRERYADAAHYLATTLAALRADESTSAGAFRRTIAARSASGFAPVAQEVSACRAGVNDAVTVSVVPATPPANEQSSGPEHHLSALSIDQVQDELDVVSHRNTPVATIASPLTARRGSAGIDRLITRDGVASGSATIGDLLRLDVTMHAIDLNSGTPDGRSGYRFGSLPLGETFTAQRVSGVGGELQVSGVGYGVATGLSPREFPVRNVTGGFRVGRPDGGIMVIAARESVKDSLLSYAGARDPSTGFVWGGVVSSGASVHASRDVSGTGQYLSLRGAWITGQNVAKNWSVEGTGGTYWGVFETSAGALSLGVSGTAIHYDRNLNFFSFGQGGYFSPQQYLLASVPISWRKQSRAFAYEVSASGGGQFIKEGASPFYPTQPLEGQSFYPDHATRGSNYNFATRFAYWFSPHSYIEAFATANNAKNFASQTVGVSLKLFISRLPTTTDLHPKAIPDWRGRPPFGL
jgi:tetratricopeptide (TPR) repeat protein